MNRPGVDAIVIGAGVIGLTSALSLTEAGFHVEVWTAESPDTTTSMAAGAMWGPYLAEPLDRVTAWSRYTHDVLQELSSDPATGVRLVTGVEAARSPASPPAWSTELADFRMCTPTELPAGFSAGWRFTAPLVEMPQYLGYLQERLVAGGGSIKIKTVRHLREAAAEAPLIINCTGMGARTLVPDPTVHPIRGQLVVVENPGIGTFFSEDTGDSPDLTHWYPFGETLVLGGTAEPGGWNRQPIPEAAAAIIRRCAQIEPSLHDARVLAFRVGLRPTRPTVRLQAQTLDTARLIHNYGHGGAGVTLSWGCAQNVVDLALE